jgi:Meiotically up-regulated gene 113
VQSLQCRSADRPTGYVYFIQDGLSRYVKIGWTTDSPFRRLQTLQTGCPGDLSVAAMVRGTEDLEKALHKRFAHYRIRGEWFDPQVLSAIDVAQDDDPVPYDYHDAFWREAQPSR